ncbi:MAG: hypothetical protein GKS00_21060 [Alphaproteobacteria bacterium]|nr:hypothetical protein [Alphaproteobacteria bacterium]
MAVLATSRALLCALGTACLLIGAPAGFADQQRETQIAQKGKALGPKEVQQRLKDLGFDPGPIDGAFTDQTISALRAFQIKAGIAATGTLDDATMQELIASGEAKMLHSLPAALLPGNTATEDFGTKVILRPVADRKGVMVLVIPRRGGYQHKLQFLGLTKDGRAHVESTVWTHGAIHEFDEPMTIAGYEFTPDEGKVLVFRVDRRKGYVFVSGEGLVKAPDGPTMLFGPDQQGVSLGHPPVTGPQGRAKKQ